MAGRRIKRDEVDDANRDITTDIRGERSSDGDLDRVGDFEVSSSRDAEGIGLRNYVDVSSPSRDKGERIRAYRNLKRVREV